MANEFEITKVRLIIRQFLWETRKAVESAEAAQKWLIQFRNTLEYQELEENPDAYALAILAEARSFNNTKQRNQQMRWVRAALEKDGIKNPTDEQLEECWMELYGKNETTADAPTREDGEFKSDSGDAGNLESATSANIYGDAAIREEAEACTCRESGCLRPSTVSNISQDALNGNAGDESLVHPAPNMRRVPQNEAPAHGFSGGRTAQGTMSRSPEAAAQSGKAYDQETYQVSTDEARESRRTGAPVRGATSSTAPVRSLRLPTWDEFNAFIDAKGLDYTDAREWWEMTMVDREGKDRDGKPIGNWKAALKRFCAAKINNRRSA